jgi:hypothetical protein
MIKRPNLRIHGVKDRAEISTTDIGNLFNEIITENSPNIDNHINTHMQETF